MSTSKRTVLIICLTKPHGGNLTTANRIRNLLHETGCHCIIKSISDFDKDGTFKQFLEQNQVQCIIALHALHTARAVAEAAAMGKTSVILVLGGTDVNEYYKDPEKLKIMTGTVILSRFLVAFNKCLSDRAMEIWPFCSSKIVEIKQSVNAVPSPTFDTFNFLFTSYGDKICCNKEDILLFTLVASVRAVKDPLYLCQEFSDWHCKMQKRPYLILAGPVIDDKYGRLLEENIEGLPGILYIHCLPHQDMLSFVRDSFALVNSSLSEGMAAAILEAMFLKTPVLARFNEGNANLIEDGTNGFLYRSPEEFVAKAERLITRKEFYSTISDAAFEYVDSHHSCLKERDLYTELLNMVYDAPK